MSEYLQSNQPETAVVLLSGGLDSSTALAWAIKEKGWHCYTLAFDYGQRHRIELVASKRIAASLGVQEHCVLRVDLASIGGSALTADIAVPKDEQQSDEIPVTYVPARNLIFLSMAAAFAEERQASRLVIGANVVDYSGYPDCRPEFFTAFAQTLKLATRAGAEGRDTHIETPLIDLKKSQIIAMGLKFGLDYSLTHSCYDPLADGRPCGHCDSCLYRRTGFGELGLTDPLPYPE
ncbi:MAG: 7-cyano-7-deazaguanine synthase QueC [Mariprofundaceae bacterium]|nr:7-cyano-7-deazaguanine synthase QueC [Mariprofundaceae bacterium]